MQEENTADYSEARNLNKNNSGKNKSVRLPSKVYFDFSIFRNNRFTLFEALVKYLKEEKGFTYHNIGIMLNRNERNIWTVYNRGRKK